MASTLAVQEVKSNMPFYNEGHSLNSLAISVRHFLNINSTIYETYFVKRSMFNPIDELSFECDWKAFIETGSQLCEKMELYIDFFKVKALKHTTYTILVQQISAFQAWFKKLKQLMQFSHISRQLERLLKHEPVLDLHKQICCTEVVIAILLGEIDAG